MQYGAKLGIDLGKMVFHLVGVDASGAVVLRKKCSRTQLLVFTANVRVGRILPVPTKTRSWWRSQTS
jgi:hypothetical protein